ncbi:MAG: hypothetical protein ACTSXG_01715 [Alphaproteobacteria bacterium]
MFYFFIISFFTIAQTFSMDTIETSVDEFQQQSFVPLKLHEQTKIKESKFTFPECTPIDCREEWPTNAKCPDFYMVLHTAYNQQPKKCFSIRDPLILSNKTIKFDIKYVLLYPKFDIVVYKDSIFPESKKYI